MWSKKQFAGLEDCCAVMGRNRFKRIRSALRFYPSYDHYVAVRDPLWHSRLILQHLRRNCVKVAVPIGLMAYDENTIRCKGRTAARSYMKSKPIKFWIRFYATVDWKSRYIHTLWDNGSGNKTGIPPAVSYATEFKEMRDPLHRSIDDSLVPRHSASALWALQMTHPTRTLPAPSRRIVVTDNFYTRQVLGEQLKRLFDNELFLLGTVWTNNFNGINRHALKTAIEGLKEAPRGAWRLFQAFNKASDNNSTRRRSKQNLTHAHDSPSPIENDVVWKDLCTVVFYCNNLDGKPTAPVMASCKTSIKCVHGLTNIRRWMGTEAMHATVIEVPAILMSYNLFMNGIDRFDQLRSSHSIEREKRVPMSVFTLLLDPSIVNAFALYNTM